MIFVNDPPVYLIIAKPDLKSPPPEKRPSHSNFVRKGLFQGDFLILQ